MSPQPQASYPRFEISTQGKKLYIETAQPLMAEPFMQQARTMVILFNEFNTKVALKSWSVARQGSSGQFDYAFEAVDGRKWAQKLYFDTADWTKEPDMTFDVTHRWKQAEFTPHRAIRDLVTTMIQTYGLKSAAWVDV